MARFPFRLTAIGLCLFMVAVMALLQFVLTPTREAPWFLFFLFVGLWLFGAGMLLRFPRFGAAGTAAWGILSAIGVVQTHEALDAENLVLLLGSLGASGAAIGTWLTKDW